MLRLTASASSFGMGVGGLDIGGAEDEAADEAEDEAADEAGGAEDEAADEAADEAGLTTAGDGRFFCGFLLFDAGMSLGPDMLLGGIKIISLGTHIDGLLQENEQTNG